MPGYQDEPEWMFRLGFILQYRQPDIEQGIILDYRSHPHHYRVRRPARSCPLRRDSSPEIHREFPVRVAILPSRLTAAFMLTNGKPVVIYLKTLRSTAVLPLPKPGRHFDPFSSSSLKPAPLTLGFGSVTATTTRVIPAAINWLVQGGFRPKWQQGSRFT